jgi:hypothetical protein
MIFSRVDFPEPFRPMTPILAPGKKESQIPLRISLPGGTIFFSPCMV